MQNQLQLTPISGQNVELMPLSPTIDDSLSPESNHFDTFTFNGVTCDRKYMVRAFSTDFDRCIPTDTTSVMY